MKTIKKSTLLNLKADTLKYEKTGDMAYLSDRIVKAKQLSTQAYGGAYAWLSFVDLIDSIFGVYGLYRKCTNEELFELLRALKFNIDPE